MTMHLGDVPASTTLYIPFATYGKTNGESITLTGLAVTDIEIYKNGSTTQRASDNGYTLLDTDGIDFDGITGIHGFSIDLSDNSDSGFYAVGSWYWVVVSAVTVDSQTVNFIAATFRIVTAEAITGKPKVDVDAWLGTAAATPTTAGVPEVDVTHWLGTAAATPTTAGVPEVDITHIAGSAVSTTTAQIGCNIVQVSGDSAAADNLESEFDGTGYGSGYIRRGTAQAGAAGTITLDASASSDNDNYNNLFVAILSGTGAGQCRRVRAYTGSTKVIDTDANWVVTPDATSVFGLYPNYSANVLSWLNQTVATPTENGVPVVNVRAISGDVTAADNLESWFDNTGYAASNSSIGTATAVTTVNGFAAGAITAAAIAADAIGVSELAADAANEIADALLDRSAGIETGYTLRQAVRLILSACAAKLSGAGTTTITIKDVGDTKTRISATVDADGNRTAVTLDAT